MRAEKHLQTLSQRGFTLLEIIVSITIAGIMGVILIQFAGTAITLSANPVKMVRNEVASQGIMEEIISQYVMEINENPATALADLVTFIGTEPYSANVTTYYIIFVDGSEQISVLPTNTLIVVVQVDNHKQTAILAKNRAGATELPISY